MKLENLYTNFGQLDDNAQLEFIVNYRQRRSLDINRLSTSKTQSSISNKVELTPDEKLLVKLMGLKTKDILALRAIAPTEEEEGDLFDDNSLIEGDE